MNRSLNLSQAEADRLDQQIADLAAKRDAIKARARTDTDALIAELKNSSYEVAGYGVRINPSCVMAAILPTNVGSQDQFEIPLKDGLSIHVDDWGVTLSSPKREDVAGRLTWLAKQGVARERVEIDKHGVKSAEFRLKQAVEERDALQAIVVRAFE